MRSTSQVSLALSSFLATFEDRTERNVTHGCCLFAEAVDVHPVPAGLGRRDNASLHHRNSLRWKYSRPVVGSFVGSFFGLPAARCELSAAADAAVLRRARG